jgi:hypothetical protein
MKIKNRTPFVLEGELLFEQNEIRSLIFAGHEDWNVADSVASHFLFDGKPMTGDLNGVSLGRVRITVELLNESDEGEA